MLDRAIPLVDGKRSHEGYRSLSSFGWWKVSQCRGVADADVSTVTATDAKVLILRADDGDCIQHLDFQSGSGLLGPSTLQEGAV
jgi:hypothetical protein